MEERPMRVIGSVGDRAAAVPPGPPRCCHQGQLMETAEGAGARQAVGGPNPVVSEILGRLFSILVLGWAIFLGGSSSLVFLWGLWIEEVLGLVGLSIRKALVRRAGLASAPIGMYFAFPAAHLVFVLFFTLIGTTGLFSRGEGALLEAPRAAVLAEVAAAFLFWTVVDVARGLLRRRRGGSAQQELAAIDRSARLALFLPHVTIIAGGFCLVVFGLQNWLAWGILVGKALFELMSFAVSRQTPPA